MGKDHENPPAAKDGGGEDGDDTYGDDKDGGQDEAEGEVVLHLPAGRAALRRIDVLSERCRNSRSGTALSAGPLFIGGASPRDDTVPESRTTSERAGGRAGTVLGEITPE